MKILPTVTQMRLKIALLMTMTSVTATFAQTDSPLFGKHVILKSEPTQVIENTRKEKNSVAKFLGGNSAESDAINRSPSKPEKTLPRSYTTAQIDSFIKDSCRRYAIDPKLIYAQMRQESSFKLRATSYKGARGLMQLMPATARRFGVTDIYDPRQNIEAGVKYMRWLMNLFGDVRLALAGYNAGEGAVMRYGNRIPPYRETIQYVEKIGYHYFGERGHGTSFAWNLSLAARYAGVNFGGKNTAGSTTTAMTGRADTLEAADRSSKDSKIGNSDVLKNSQSDRLPVNDPSGRVLSSSLFIVKQ